MLPALRLLLITVCLGWCIPVLEDYLCGYFPRLVNAKDRD